MRQWAAQILLCVALGAATTVGVAWAFAWLNRVATRSMTGAAVVPSGWHVAAYEECGVRHLSGSLTAWTGRNPAALEPLPRIFRRPPDGELHVEYTERGWPCFALSCTGASAATSQYGPHDRVAWGISLDRENAPWKFGDFADAQLIALPLMPVWPGFALDTLIYAATWMGFGAFRAFARKRVPSVSARLATVMACVALILGATTTVAVALGCAFWIDDSLDWSNNRRFGTDGYARNQSFGRWWLFEESTPGAVRLSSSLFLGGGGSGGGPDCDADDLCPSWARFVRPLAEWLERENGGGYTFGHHPDRARWENDHNTMKAWGRRELDARGWPMLALWGGVRFRQWLPPGASSYRYDPVESRYTIHRVRVREDGEYDWHASRIIPLMPIWPGFAVNSLVYGASWILVGLALVGPKAFVRGARLRRGRCPLCGYDLRGQRQAANHERLANGTHSVVSSELRCPECGWKRSVAAMPP